ncbi:MAG: NERD domain-containing protein [Alphaproteobacteria bacterium]|nr:NERD domain-containing protein [Alphaproteobacteria bacterium]
MVKALIDFSLPSPVTMQKYIDETDALMSELHKAMGKPLWENLDNTNLTKETISNCWVGKALREPMFYAGEAAYMFQYRDFSAERYLNDAAWLSMNKGFLPSDLKIIIQTISKSTVHKILELTSQCAIEHINTLTLLPAFTASPEEISSQSGIPLERVKNVILAFSLPPTPCNLGFLEFGDYNQTNSHPIIPAENGRFVLLQEYCLAESAYESPFFWTSGDLDYEEVAKENRGLFAESFSARRLEDVFNEGHIYRNVHIRKGNDEVGEIDVLVVYSDRVILLEAKSKKLTLSSKKGDAQKIRSDFESAVQKAYDQNFRNANFLLNEEYNLYDEAGVPLEIRRNYAEVFILCLVSDYYPSLAFQARQFLKVQEHKIISPPYVMDIFFLDTLCEMLDTPLHFFNFLHRRLRYSERVHSETELAILSFHLANNLWFDDKYDLIDLGEDFSVHLDAAMFSRRDSLPGDKTPKGILTKFQGTFFEYLIQKIGEREDDHILALGYLLLEMSEDSVKSLSDGCKMILDQTLKDGCRHDITMGFQVSGICVHSASNWKDKDEIDWLLNHCQIAKYRSKADTWFGIALDPKQEDILQGIVGIRLPWQKDRIMDEALKNFSKSSGGKSLKDAIRSYDNIQASKTGRNSLCICGSGKKDKRCCKNSSR